MPGIWALDVAEAVNGPTSNNNSLALVAPAQLVSAGEDQACHKWKKLLYQPDAPDVCTTVVVVVVVVVVAAAVVVVAAAVVVVVTVIVLIPNTIKSPM